MQRIASGLIQIRSELCKRCKLAILSKVNTQTACDLLHCAELSGTADTGYRKTDVYCRANAGVEQITLKEDLTVGDGNDVCRDISGDIACLRFDDRQSSHAAAAGFCVESSCSFKQSGVQVENIAGVCFASGRSLKQQRNFTISGGLLAQVIVYYENVLAVVHEVFAHCSACVRRDIKHGSRLRCRCGNDDRVIHRAVAAQLFDNARYGGFLLADGNVDADDILALLVDDSIKRDRGLTCLAVADDKLTLAAADRNKRIYSLQAGLQRHGNGLS